MKLSADQIEEKCIAGKTKDGRPVVYVLTKGGLHSFFCKNTEGQIMSIGAAPHKAIAKFLSGKKEDIEWNKDFNNKTGKIDKSDNTIYTMLRKAMFAKPLIKKESQPSDVYIVYDINKEEISLMKHSEISNAIKDNKLQKFALIRELSLKSKAIFVKDHDSFSKLFEGKI